MEVPMKSKVCQICTICLVSVSALIFMASCASLSESTPPHQTEITDQLGRAVRLETAPQRIISLAPSNTEILFALGLANRVAAVTDYCNYPPEVEAKPSIGGFSTPNIEEIVALSPDLILATSQHEDRIIPQLEGKGLTVVALNPKTIDEALEAIALTGKACGVEGNAAELIGSMRQRIKMVTDITAGLAPEQRPRVLYTIWHDPWIIAGSETLQNELILKAGGTNICQSLTDYPTIGLEAIIEDNPEVIITNIGHGTGEDLTLQFIKAESRLKDIDARRNNRVYGIDADLSSRPGPRISEALELFAKFIHPELFP
jgi:iron complex transport system substrate-binding protein